MRAVVMHASGAGRNSILNSLSCRVTRRGAANGAQEFNGILKLHTAAEERTAIYQGWVSACRKGHTKAEESGDSKKAREYVEAEQSVLQQIAAELGASASECVPSFPAACPAVCHAVNQPCMSALKRPEGV